VAKLFTNGGTQRAQVSSRVNRDGDRRRDHQQSEGKSSTLPDYRAARRPNSGI
jgi:hypothetical protein